MDGVTERVHEEGEGAKEGDEGENDAVEESVPGEDVGELGVEEHEADGHREVDPGLEEGYNLGAAAFGRDDEHVLGVSEDGVVEEDAEEHKPQRDNLLQRHHLHAQEFLRLRHPAVTHGSNGDSAGVARLEIPAASFPPFPPPESLADVAVAEGEKWTLKGGGRF